MIGFVDLQFFHTRTRLERINFLSFKLRISLYSHQTVFILLSCGFKMQNIVHINVYKLIMSYSNLPKFNIVKVDIST